MTPLFHLSANLKFLFSTESFIEVPEEESKQEDTTDSSGEKKVLEAVQKDETKKEEESEGRLTEVPDKTALGSDKEEETEVKDQEKQLKDEADEGSTTTAANDEWEELDMVSIPPKTKHICFFYLLITWVFLLFGIGYLFFLFHVFCYYTTTMINFFFFKRMFCMKNFIRFDYPEPRYY